MMLRSLALAGLHHELGARFAPFAGWQMPVQYSGIIDEHTAVRSRAEVLGVSDMGRVEVRGAGGRWQARAKAGGGVRYSACSQGLVASETRPRSSSAAWR